MNIMQIITDYIARSTLTTKGDLVVRGDSLPERLAAGTLGRFLQANGSGQKPSWQKVSISDFDIAHDTILRSTGGVENVNGLGFDAKLVLLLARTFTGGGPEISIGWINTLGQSCVTQEVGGTTSQIGTSNCIRNYIDASNYMLGVGSLVTGGFSINFTLVGTATTRFNYLAIG
ncbi:MAG: hypothetical protein GWN93_20820 [Deltaproteobacteria bacterium]|nr:hypothetical protein [Deltaproteobacteria bacterium]